MLRVLSHLNIGIVAFKHLKTNYDLDINHRPLKHEPVKDINTKHLCEVILKSVQR